MAQDAACPDAILVLVAQGVVAKHVRIAHRAPGLAE